MQQNKGFNRWVVAARPRTLPLALAGPSMASCIALGQNTFSGVVAFLAILTTLFLQILSNYANDYGDFLKGSDVSREGPPRALQSGLISLNEMKKAIIITSLLAFITGFFLIFFAAHWLTLITKIIFLIIGTLAIIASMKYTLGKNPYGYRGFGDLFVFVFFGIISTLGTYMLHTNTFNSLILLPAISLGALSAGVLNINNIRDYNTDIQHQKRTLVVIMGVKFAKVYHMILICISVFLSVVYASISFPYFYQWIFLLVIPFLIQNVLQIKYYNEANIYNKALKNLAVTTFCYCILLGLGHII